MKMKTSMKICKNYDKVYAISYGNAQDLLVGIDPRWYNCDVYGWNCDIYQIDVNTLVTTGYRNTRGITVDYDFLRKYNEKAKKIRYRYSWKYETRMRKIDELRKEFFTLLAQGKGV